MVLFNLNRISRRYLYSQFFSESFENTAENIYQDVEAELKRGSLMQWKTIRSLISKLHRIDVGSSLRIKELIFKVLSLSHKHKCPDISIIADIAELLCCIDSNCDVEDQPIRLLENGTLTPMSTFENILYFSYRDISSLFLTESDNKRLIPWNWVRILATNGRVRLLKVILSLGATLVVPENIPYEWFQYIVMKLLSSTNQSATEMESLKSCVLQNFEFKFNTYSRKRLYLILMVLDIFVQYDFHRKLEKYIECARILVYFTPEPLITSEEIKTFLIKFCNDIVLNDKLMQFLEKYESYFPESREVLTPRSLMHLSRFQVRENLRTAKSFPHGVKSLFIPDKIADYICFKDICLQDENTLKAVVFN